MELPYRFGSHAVCLPLLLSSTEQKNPQHTVGKGMVRSGLLAAVLFPG